MSEMWDARCSRFRSENAMGERADIVRCLSSAVPALPHALVHQCMGSRCVEIRTLPALLPAGTFHLERTILSRAAVDHAAAAHGSDAVPLPGVPLQLRQLSAL